MGAFKIPVRLGLIVGSRLFFNGAPALAAREQAIDQLGKLGISVKTLPADATENGAVQSRKDAALYGDFFRSQRDEIDGLVAAWLPGSEGAGVADTLFGARPFTGRLPMTWPRSLDQEPINVGDRHYNPLFPYGWGLRTGYINAPAPP